MISMREAYEKIGANVRRMRRLAPIMMTRALG